ncbi:ATP-binding protein [Undibacterium sp.]|uniref:ATP-binding protein n=1 Tax=Undibacterium sp. TaxID=1914977 RepID=UPI0037523280
MSGMDVREELLKRCQEIPVISPGTIQDHGALIAIDRRSLSIDYVSENIESILGQPSSHWLNQRFRPDLHELFPLLVSAIESGDESSYVIQSDAVEMRVSRNTSHCLIEFFHFPETTAPTSFSWNKCSHALLNAPDLGKLHHAVMEALHALIQFDHLMVYRFDDKWNGSVDAEWIHPHAKDNYESYLDLCFPESDIPVQARNMYTHYWVRNTADVNTIPIALHANSSTPLLLAPVYLRSVAPSHVLYLKNMGVTASFSLSIMVDGKLWGLLAAHHNSPRPLSPAMMETAEELARLYSSLLTLILRREHHQWLDQHTAFINSPTLAASQGKSPLDMSEEVLQHMCTQFNCHAALIWDGEVKASFGEIVSEQFLSDLVARLQKCTFIEHVFQTDKLRDHFPELKENGIAGVLAMSAPIEAGRAVLMLRKEEPQEIAWGGDPRLEAMAIEKGMLSPRNSFQVWKQTLHGVSRPWTTAEIIVAKAFSNKLMMANASLGTLESAQKTAKLNLLNMLLHDIGNALSGISGGATHLRQQTQDQSALQNLKRLTDYFGSQIVPLDHALGAGRGGATFQLLTEIQMTMEKAFDSIHQATDWIETSVTHARELLDLQKTYAQSSSQYSRECQVVELLSDALSVLRTNIDSRGTVTIKLAERLPALTVDRSKLMQVIINLIKNAFEAWDARLDDKPKLELQLTAFTKDEVLYIEVKDNGCGFTADMANKLFIENFSTKDRSSGLGLANCRRLAHNTGADLDLSSAGVNTGATATISIRKELWI